MKKLISVAKFLITALVTVVFAVGGFEIYLRMLPGDKAVLIGDATFAPKVEADKWRRWFMTVYERRGAELRTANGTVMAPVLLNHGGMIFDPDLGWDTNATHYVSTHEYAAERPANAPLRVMTIGDSFTYGADVPRDASYPMQLERALGGGAEVVNFGVPGYGVDQMVLKFERYGAAFRPDVVVFAFFEPDYVRSTVPFYFSSKPQFVLAGDEVRLTNVPVLPPDESFAKLKSEVKDSTCLACDFLREKSRQLYVHLNRRGVESRYDAEWNRVHEFMFDRLKKAVDATGARMIAMYIPIDSEFVNASRYAGAEKAARHRWFVDAMRARGVETLDLLKEFPARHSLAATHDSLYLPHGHFTPAGNQAVALMLKEVIEKDARLAARAQDRVVR